MTVPGTIAGTAERQPQCLDALSFLVVEDHPLQRQMLVLALRTLGAVSVEEAVDGHDALNRIRRATAPVDIIICDLDMPGMDGMAFIRHLGEHTDQPSLIVISALESGLVASVETMAHAYGIRLLGTIEKPATPQKLHETINRHDGAAAPRLPASPRPLLPEADIVAALDENRFEAWFQPKVDLSAGTLVGAEALARMRHPVQGVIAPARFIGFLEENGLIDQMTWSMLRQSAAACAEWQRHGLQLTVSVNLSLKSLADPALADHITSLVREQGVDPRMMVLEITESAAMTEVGPALENLARLRMKGFGLSIDDFGTGYSSMQQLARISFTELKIDRSFVADAGTNPQRNIMLESSNDLARRLGLKAVAEGVETRSDWEHLQRIGCSIAQGYFIAQPMPADEFLRWALAWRPEEKILNIINKIY
ncbi:MAG: EAL domain-containing protein [Burkholderiales bacterium]